MYETPIFSYVRRVRDMLIERNKIDEVPSVIQELQECADWLNNWYETRVIEL